MHTSVGAACGRDDDGDDAPEMEMRYTLRISKLIQAASDVNKKSAGRASKLFDALHPNFQFDLGTQALIMATSRVGFGLEVFPMKRSIFILAGAVVLLPATATAQHSSKASESKPSVTANTDKSSQKAETLLGQVSADGKKFLSDEDDIWTVSNPEVLSGHAGHYVSLRCSKDSSKNEIYVFSAKAAVRDAKYVSKTGDAAFRR